MKIAFLNIYSGINNRGAEAFCHQLANRLMKKHQIFFYQAGKKTVEQKFNVMTIKVKAEQPQSQFPKSKLAKLCKYFFLDKANISIFWFTLKTLLFILKEKNDWLVCLNGFWQLLLLKIIQPFGKFKLLVAGHAGPGWDERFNLYLKPNTFVALTKPAYQWAKKTCAWTRVEFIPLAVDDFVFQKAKTAKLNLIKPIILCPAALTGYKRVDLVIKAAAKLGKTSLLVLGQGELKAEIESFGSRLLKHRFQLLSVSHDKIASYYKACDIVTLPSLPQENSPMVFLEALAAGKLVVAADTPRNRWILDKAGIFCDPADIDDYSKALKKAIAIKDNNEIKTLIKKAFAKFRWQKVLAKYESLFNNLDNKV